MDSERTEQTVLTTRSHAGIIVTRDAKGFPHSPVPAIAPSDFLTLLEERYGVVYGEIKTTG